MVAQISDLHYGKDLPELPERLLEALDSIAPDLVIVSGDFAQRAWPSEFRKGRALVDRLPAPWIAIPGNHDIAHFNLVERLFSPLATYHRVITRERDPTRELPGLRVLALNTTRRTTSGRIRDYQLPLIDRLGEGDPDAWRILVTHHPLTRKPPQGAEGALAAAARARVDILLAGHFHRTVVTTVGDMVSLEAATPISDRASPKEIPPWAFNVLRLARATLTFERWASDGGSFSPTEPRAFTRRNAGAPHL
ncbi:MAG: hypothetical protein QOF76_3334 [Solirubrobacteraceae bacterium]|nr:hypothetical protein [Solirubrobacteraceae bacterium]